MGQVSKPVVLRIEAQSYVFTRIVSSQDQVGTVIPQALARVTVWLNAQKITPGIAIVRYRRIASFEMTMDVGFMTDKLIIHQGDMTGDILPEGTYASVGHTGPYDEITHAHMALHNWAQKMVPAPNWDMSDGPNGQSWNALVELYHTDPMLEPDSGLWQSQVIVRLKD